MVYDLQRLNFTILYFNLIILEESSGENDPLLSVSTVMDSDQDGLILFGLFLELVDRNTDVPKQHLNYFLKQNKENLTLVS